MLLLLVDYLTQRNTHPWQSTLSSSYIQQQNVGKDTYIIPYNAWSLVDIRERGGDKTRSARMAALGTNHYNWNWAEEMTVDFSVLEIFPSKITLLFFNI